MKNFTLMALALGVATPSCATLAQTANSAQKAASAPVSIASAATKSAASPSTEELEGGIVVVHTQRGKGDKPTAEQSVKVHYKGSFPDGPNKGQEFDSSYKRNEPATFPLKRVIKCWTMGVATMQPGGKATLTCPPGVAYGERGAGNVIPPNATLKFDVELLEVLK